MINLCMFVKEEQIEREIIARDRLQVIQVVCTKKKRNIDIIVDTIFKGEATKRIVPTTQAAKTIIDTDYCCRQSIKLEIKIRIIDDSPKRPK